MTGKSQSANLPHF